MAALLSLTEAQTRSRRRKKWKHKEQDIKQDNDDGCHALNLSTHGSQKVSFPFCLRERKDMHHVLTLAALFSLYVSVTLLLYNM